MQETIEFLLDLLRNAWRFRIWAIATAWVVCPLGWFFVMSQPDVYEAKARILINTSSDLREILDDQIVERSGVQQLRNIRDSLLGAESLKQLITETELEQFAQSSEELRNLTEMLRERILVESTYDSRRNARSNERFFTDTYEVIYPSTSRQGAVEVVEKLLEIFQRDLNSADSSGNGERFLLKQKEEYETRLRSAEEKLADFNRRYFDRLPNREGGYFEQLQEESRALESARTDLRLSQARLESLDQQLRGESSGLTSGDVDDESSLEARIRSTQIRLDELLLRFTREHPEVITAESILATLREQQKEQTRILRSGDQVAVTNNPVYQAIRISQNEVRTEVARLEATVGEREARVEQLRELIDEMPDVEAELAQMTRDTEVLQGQYQAILSNIERERLSRQVSQTAPLQVQVLDPPSASSNPVAPNRPIQHFLVLVFGVGLAAGLAVVLGQLQPVYSQPTQMVGNFNVIGAISRHMSEAQQRQRVWSYAWFALSSVLLATVFIGVLLVDLIGIEIV